MSALFIILFSLILIIFLLDALRLGIAPMPTSKKVKDKIMSSLPKKIEGDVLELGSGFGGMAFSLSDHFKEYSVLSYERGKIPCFFQKLKFLVKHKSNLFLHYKNFLNEDFSSAGLVFCYLYRNAMPKLAKKFNKELRAGTWVLTHTFAIEGWKPVHTFYADDLYKTPIYLYRVFKN